VTLLVLAIACKPPPDAPQGLDDSTAFMMREFYKDDASFQAGVQGFMQWYEDEGYLLVGESATTSNTDSFSVGELSVDDVAHLPLSEEILLDSSTDTWGPRDLSNSKGVVSLAMMDCTWEESEQYLLRPDQDSVFIDDWESYDRTYTTSHDAYEAATISGEFEEVTEETDVFAADFDGTLVDSTQLLTTNQVDPTAVLFVDLGVYEMNLDFRHGQYEVGDDTIGLFAITSYQKDAVWDEAGENGLIQTYSVEINAQQGDQTLRMLAVWAEPVGAGLSPDDPLVLNFAVNKSLDSSNRLSAVCAGEESVD
jgi:hypothetical protein